MWRRRRKLPPEGAAGPGPAGGSRRPTRIGIMLRHVDQHAGGVKVYTQNMLPRLLAQDPQTQYVLMYCKRSQLGAFAGRPNVEEVAISLPGKLLWDQIGVPWIARRKKLDLVFNMKFTVPLLARTKKVFVLHGFEWFTIPQAFRWLDRRYARALIPIYCRRADAIITIAEAVKSEISWFTGVSPAKIFPIPYGIDASLFRVISDRRHLEEVRQRYALPNRFVLWVGQIYPPKNLGRLLRAFARNRADFDHHLVLAGEKRWQGAREFRLVQDLGLTDRVHFPGWVSHEHLPAFYNLADLFVLPSLHEGFGIPLLEAMASGCPVLTSKTGTPPEVVGEAGYLVNPLDVEEIATGMRVMLTESRLRESLREKGLQRAAMYRWEQCASRTLRVLHSVAGRGRVLDGDFKVVSARPAAA